MFIAPYDAFTRPADTTQYAANDLIANSTTAASVVPMRFNCSRLKGHGIVLGARLWKSTATVTSAKFNLHLYTQSPTVTNGDNGAYAVSTTKWWIATIACDMSTGSEVSSADSAQYFPLVSSSGLVMPVPFDLDLDGQSDGLPSAGKVYSLFGLLEAATAGTYTPGNAEIFRVVLNIGE